ncbi:MAG: F0F1 ATP synthase subunit gamma [Candidatus Goldbacteria bacterium]|nr:F0F1 ATP synthase subunit gamma [Candidatus Goldiibacteriota bacterium]
MQSPEEVKRKLSGAESLKSIVRTMKVLAAVNVRQYEKMSAAVDSYNEIVEMGFRVFLGADEKKHDLVQEKGNSAFIILGSDMGMCGRFNDQIASHALEAIGGKGDNAVMAVGDKVSGKLEDAGIKPEETIIYPAVLSAGIVPLLREIILIIDRWRETRNINSITVFYNKPADSLSYSAASKMILPMEPGYLEELRKREWKSNSIPIYKEDSVKLFSSLVKNYIYVSLYRAFVESLVSENTARLVSMQAAEKHTAERIEELTLEYNMERQDAITSEILDIIAGAEAVEGK